MRGGIDLASIHSVCLMVTKWPTLGWALRIPWGTKLTQILPSTEQKGELPVSRQYTVTEMVRVEAPSLAWKQGGLPGGGGS